MSGRDHETDHDGECFKECRECRIERLTTLTKNAFMDGYSIGRDHPSFDKDEAWDRSLAKRVLSTICGDLNG